MPGCPRRPATVRYTYAYAHKRMVLLRLRIYDYTVKCYVSGFQGLCTNACNSVSGEVLNITSMDNTISNQMIFNELSSLKVMVSDFMTEINSLRKEKVVLEKTINSLSNNINMLEQEKKSRL